MKNVGFVSKKKKFEIENIYQDGIGINNCFFFLVYYMSSTFYTIEI